MQNATQSPPAGVIGEPVTKVCTKCRQALPISSFSIRRKEPDGLNFHCRECVSIAAKARYRSNPNRYKGRYTTEASRLAARKRAAEWYANNPERAKDAGVRRRQRIRDERTPYVRPTPTPEEVAARLARKKAAKAASGVRCYARSKELVKARARDWAKENPERLRVVARGVQARRRAGANRAAWADAREIDKLYAKTLTLSKLTGVAHHLDHVYPLVSKLVCGLHVQQNLQPVPAQLNRAKGNKLPGHLAHELWDPQAREVFYA